MTNASLLISAMIVCLLVACGQKDGQPEYDVFRYNEENNVMTLDPAFARSNNVMWITNQLFDGLVELDSNLQVVPSIAKTWDISEDGLTYTFDLRDDVYWHDDVCWGDQSPRRVVASDVVYSLDRIISPDVGSPGSWIFRGRVRADSPFEAPNDSTFVLHLDRPFAPMLGILTMQYCNVVPREAVEHYGDRWRQHPVGSGPFRLKRWVPNQAIYLNASTNYYVEDLPYIDGVKISFVGDKKIAFLDLLAGNIDFFNGLESSFIDDLLTKEGTLQPKYKDRLNYIKSPYLNLEYVGFNHSDTTGPLADVRVRQAMNYAIDRETMLATLRNNVGQPASAGAIPRGLPGHGLVDGYSYDIAEAQQLLQEAGYEQVDVTLKTNADYLDVCTYIRNQWQKIGINVEIEVVEAAYLREAMRQGDIQLFRASWIADYPDAESYMCLFYSELPAPPNYTRYSNPDFDRLYEQSIQESDPGIRLQLFKRMDSLIVNDAAMILLFYDEKAQFTAQRVAGLSSNAVNMLDLSRVRIEGG
jgi:peptide/nickel transport system substrate-binding protein